MKRSIRPPSRRYKRAFAPNLSRGQNYSYDSRVLPFDMSEEAYNVSVESGALEAGYGAESTNISARYGMVYYYRTYDEQSETYSGHLIAYDSLSGKTGVLRGGEWSEIQGAEFASPPVGTNYRLYGEDVYLLCGDEGMAVVHPDFRAVTVSSAPKITSVAMHNERMFVTVGGRRNAVWFSDDLNPTNWNPELDEGGFIELEGDGGKLNKAVAFGGYVYLFRDYGIARLTAYGDQSEFSVTNLFVSGGKIYGNTALVCGDRIMFLAAGGLYSFDGVSAVRVCEGLSGLFERFSEPVACYHCGKYFIASGEYLVAIDARTKVFSVSKGMEILAFSPIAGEDGEQLLACVKGGETLGKIVLGADVFGIKQKRLWRGGMTDLGSPESRKLITDAYINSKYDCVLSVRTERGQKSVRIKGGAGVRRKRINLLGTMAGIEITAEGELSAARPALRYTVVN